MSKPGRRGEEGGGISWTVSERARALEEQLKVVSG